MNLEILIFSGLLLFLLIHLFGNTASSLGWIWHGRFLSFASGVTFAYVFIDLLPTLERGDQVIQHTFQGVLPFLNRHAYLIALIGVLFTYGLQAPIGEKSTNRSFWASMAGYTLFNVFVGASLSDPNDPEIRPILLFITAMSLHYFIQDHNMREDHPDLYDNYGRWILSVALIVGWLIGYFVKIPESLIAIVVSFIAGGVLLNAMRYELPKRKKGTYIYFALGALLYSFILLKIGV